MIKIFADGADYNGIREAAKNPLVKGFTTNPSLIVKAGVKHYEQFAKNTIEHLMAFRPDTCLSLEVFADDNAEMIRQAKQINKWVEDTQSQFPVYIKIPVVNTKGVFNWPTIKELVDQEILINVTAIFTKEQMDDVYNLLDANVPAIISIFAGRIYDTGVDAEIDISRFNMERNNTPGHNMTEVLWASPRQVYDYEIAKRSGCDIITMTPDLIKKLPLLGKDLHQYSKETVQMFYNDGVNSGLTI